MLFKKLVLLTNSLAKTKAFYSTKLNFAVIQETEETVSFEVGSTTLCFQLTTQYHNPVYHFAFNIPCNQLEEALQWCESNGLEMIPYQSSKIIDFPNWNAKSIYFYENNGSILEFIARFDLKNETSSTFNASQVLSVSEIGIVVDDVNEFCANTSKEFGISFYDKQPPSSTFSVLGNAEGLMIVVVKEREWFLTTIPAQIFPLEITFKQNEKEFVLKA